jgi:hypothetical protein
MKLATATKTLGLDSCALSVALLRLFVVLGPLLLCLLIALYVGRPSTFFLASGATLTVALIACDSWIIAQLNRID